MSGISCNTVVVYNLQNSSKMLASAWTLLLAGQLPGHYQTTEYEGGPGHDLRGFWAGQSPGLQMMLQEQALQPKCNRRHFRLQTTEYEGGPGHDLRGFWAGQSPGLQMMLRKQALQMAERSHPWPHPPASARQRQLLMRSSGWPAQHQPAFQHALDAYSVQIPAVLIT